MTPEENVKRLERRLLDTDREAWERADRLAALSPLEYEEQLPQLLDETGAWSRQQLTVLRMTALRWPKEKRLPDVSFALHRQYRYKPDELESQHKAGALTKLGTLGVAAQTKPRQAGTFTLTNMAAAISAVLDLADTPSVTHAQFRKQARAILGQFRRGPETTTVNREPSAADGDRVIELHPTGKR